MKRKLGRKKLFNKIRNVVLYPSGDGLTGLEIENSFL